GIQSAAVIAPKFVPVDESPPIAMGGLSDFDAREQELARQRDLVAADREILDRARETFEAGRAAEAERLGAWEKALLEREADLGRREEEFRTDRAALERDRHQFQEDLVRLERRTAAVEEQ